jgi:predicted Mrr-cat superfamily restriction endonuclease
MINENKITGNFPHKNKKKKKKKSIRKVKWPTELAPRNSVHVVIA